MNADKYSIAGTTLTLTSALMFVPFIEAITFVVASTLLTALIIPVESTVTISSSSLCQITSLFVAILGETFALTFLVIPLSNNKSYSLNVIFVALIGVL